MSEETNKLSAFELFAQSQMTFAEAEEKAKQEAGRPRVDRFRIGEDGEYSIRIMPLAPSFDENKNPLPLERKGYEYPLHQLFLKIALPAKKGKSPKYINIPVIKTTDKDVGMSVDLIDKYVSIAKELYGDDKDLIDAITGSSFGGGLRWGYQHAMYILDVSSDKERAKGPQLWQCSNSQYSSIRDAEMRLWRELLEDGEQKTSPVSGFTQAYPVKVIRKTDKKTEYTIEIGRKTVDLTKDELTTLLDLPRIPELIYRFTRYQLEAEIVFLQQYDEEHQMDVCKEPDFIEAIETLKGELPQDDNSHFDLASAGTDKGGTAAEVTIDSLWNEYDKIVDAGLSERSDEYQELREKIRQFAEDNDLDVRLSRSKNNQQLLEEVESAYDEKQKEVKPKAEQPEDEPRRRSSRPVEEDNDYKEDKEEDAPADEQPARRRRPRPTVDDAPKDEPSEDEKEADNANDDEEANKEEVTSADTDRPLHRRRRR